MEKENKEAKDIFEIMKKALPNVKDVRFTNKLKTHPVCLSTEGNISLEMEKVLNAMPTGENVKAEIVLEINDMYSVKQFVKKHLILPTKANMKEIMNKLVSANKTALDSYNTTELNPYYASM